MEWREAKKPFSQNSDTLLSLHMDKLRGSGSTFSTSGKSWKPFCFNPTVARRNAKLYRLKRNGLTPLTDKASLRAAATEAVLKWRR